MEHIGKLLFVGGLILALSGAVLWMGGNKFSWFGNLPGDIRIGKENFRIYIPLVSMLVLSIVISIILWLVRKVWHTH